MRKLLVVIICIVVLYGCSAPDRVVNDASFIKRSGKEKIAPKQFHRVLKPITPQESQEFYTINEWYDENTVIYSVGVNGLSSLYLHNFLTGKKALFYQTEEFISKVQANSNHSLFAVQTLEQSGTSHLRILDKKGKEVFHWSDNIEELQFMWNPYEPNELAVTEFLANLDFQLLKVSVSTKKVEKIPVNNPFVQWTSKDELAYLNWNQNGPSLVAPLMLYHINTKVEEKWLERCILFFSMKDIMLAISLDDKGNQNQSLYTFYDLETRKALTRIKIPVLNTFSESWWVPSLDFDYDRKLFYYLKPKHAADITEYNEGYELRVLSLQDKDEEVLADLPDNLPIKLSPDGEWCLIGQQLEQVLNLSNKKITNLVSHKKSINN